MTGHGQNGDLQKNCLLKYKLVMSVSADLSSKGARTFNHEDTGEWKDPIFLLQLYFRAPLFFFLFLRLCIRGQGSKYYMCNLQRLSGEV